MDRLSVLCFAGTYGLALVGELARFVVRSPARWYATVGLTTLGWVVQTAYLANLAFEAQRLPIATAFESLMAVAWLLAAIDLYLIVRSPRSTAVGAFLLPLVIGLVVMAGVSAPRNAWAGWGGPTMFWGTVHGLLLLAGAASSCVAFAAGLMYLMQASRLKHKRTSMRGFGLPSLEQAERLNRGAIALAFPLLTAGLLIGFGLIAATAGGPRWADPKVISTGAMWLVFAALLHARYRPEMRGRGVMTLTTVAFAFLVFTWVGVDLLLPTAHGVPGPQSKTGGAS